MAGQAKLSILIAAKDDSAGALSKASNAIGGIAKAAAVGALAAGAAIVGMGVAAFKLGSDFDEAYDTIRVSTGKTGDALEGLKEDFRAVARDVPADFDQIGVAIGDLSARTGLTGEDLQDLAGDMLNLTRIAGGDLKGNISTITRTFGDWSIATDDQSDALNQMFRATQKTGISMSSLNEMLVTFGAPLRQLGFSFAESAGLLGKFEKEGVNTELVMGSLRIALGKMAKAGKPVKETLLETVDAIKKAGSASEANAIALKLFGAKAGPDMAAAIREGRFELGELFDEITTGADTIGAAAADTEDAAEKWKKITNKMALAVEPLASGIFDLAASFMDDLGPVIEKMTPSIVAGMKKMIEAIGGAVRWLKQLVVETKGILSGRWAPDDMMRPAQLLAGAIRVVQTALGALKDMFQAIQPYLKYISIAFALMGNPIAIASTAIRAWVEDWAEIRTKLQPVVDWLSTAIPAAFQALTSALEGGDGGGAAGFAQGVIDAFRDMSEAVMGAVGPMIDFLAPSFQRLWDAIGIFAVDVWPELEGAFNALKATIERVVIPTIKNLLDIYITVYGSILRFTMEHSDLIIGILKGMWEMIEGIVTVALATLKGIIMIGLNLIQGDWEGAWDAMTEMQEGFWNGIILIQKGATDILNNALALAWEAIKGLTAVAWDAIKVLIAAKWEEIKTAISTKINEVVGLVGALPGLITGALGNLGSLLWNAGASLIQGFIDGIVSKIAEVKRKLAELAGLIPSWKGPESADRMILFGAGQAVMQGFVAGLESQFSAVRNSLKATMGVVSNAPLRNAGAPGQLSASTIGPGSSGGTNNLASIEDAVYRGAYRGTRAALAEAI